MTSKTLLRSAETLSEANHARILAASRVEWELDFAKVSRRVLWMARDLDEYPGAASHPSIGASAVDKEDCKSGEAHVGER